jgi:hypothetical protein
MQPSLGGIGFSHAESDVQTLDIVVDRAWIYIQNKVTDGRECVR